MKSYSIAWSVCGSKSPTVRSLRWVRSPELDIEGPSLGGVCEDALEL
jgi:hypothetical protein